MSEIVWGLDSSSACTDAILKQLRGRVFFIARYYSRTTKIAGKKITPAEAQLISERGFKIVAVYEDLPTTADYFSADRGKADAEGAMQQASLIGQPKGSAIYFAVDYNAQPEDISGPIKDYFEAIAATLGDAYPAGIYGPGSACDAMLKCGYVKYAWLSQSTGFDGYNTFTGWCINQGPETSVSGLNSDVDIARGDYGGFKVVVTA